MNLMITKCFTGEDGSEVTIMSSIDENGPVFALATIDANAEAAGLTSTKKAKSRARAKKKPADTPAATEAIAPVAAVPAVPAVPATVPIADALAPVPAAPAVPAPVVVPIPTPVAAPIVAPVVPGVVPGPVPVAPPVTEDPMAQGWRDAIGAISVSLKGVLPADRHGDVDQLLIHGLLQAGIVAPDVAAAAAAVASQSSAVLNVVYNVMTANAQAMVE